MTFAEWVYTLPLRLRSLFLRQRVDRELKDELRDHLDQQINENLAKGMSPEEARFAALRAMGVTQTVILPAGTAVARPSTDSGRSNGLGGAGAGGNETAVEMARRY